MAGTVTEIGPRPVPPSSTYFGVYALTVYSHDPFDDEAGSTQDRDYTHANVMRVRWFGFTDDCALGIERYDVTLLRLGPNITSAFGLSPIDMVWQELNSTSVGRGPRSAQEMSFVLDEPGLHRVRVCGVAVTHLSACAESDGLVYDVTPPSLMDLCVRSGPWQWCSATNESVVAYVSLRHLAAARLTWYGATDAESRIAGFRWAIGTAVGSSDVREWLHVGWATSVALTPVAAGPGELSFVTVVVVNGVGLESNVSIGLVLDATPPVLGAAVLQSTSALDWSPGAIAFSNSTALSIAVHLVHMNDHESPLKTLRVEVFDVEASIDAEEPVLVSTEYLSSAGPLVQLIEVADATPRVHYQAVLYVENVAGLSSSWDATFIVDLDPPTHGKMRICDEQNSTSLVQAQTDSLRLCLSGFVEPISGLPFHRVSILRLDTGETLDSRLVRHAPLAHISGLDLPCGETVEVMTEALSGASVAAVPLTRQILIDCTRPLGGMVGFTTARDLLPARVSSIFCSLKGDAVYGWWGGFDDEESDAAEYQFSLRPSGSDVPAESEWETAGPRQLALLRTVDLESAPFNYTLHARACNTAGLCSDGKSSSFPLVVVVDSPTAGVVTIGAHSNFLSRTDVLDLSWQGFTDVTVGFAHTFPTFTPLEFDVCLGTTPYGCQINGFAHAGGNSSWKGTDLTMPCGGTIFASVRATNCAGKVTTTVSEGIKLCCEPPLTGTLTLVDSAGDATNVVGDGMSVVVTWAGFSERCSGLRDYFVALQQSETSTVLWSSSTTRQYAALPEEMVATLQHATVYVVTVTATSNAGHSASVSTSMLVDRSPPFISNVEVRWGGAASHWAELNATTCLPAAATFVQARWLMTDAESELITREISLSGAVSDNAAGWETLTSMVSLRFQADSLPGQLGGSTFFAARACNRVGLCSLSNYSAGLVREQRPPSGGHVQVAASPGASNGFLHSSELSVAWGSFTPAGCPGSCGTNASHYCYYDPSCAGNSPRLGGVGCNAGGVGALCRACGFGTYEPCPQMQIGAQPSFGLRYEICLGTTRYGCQLMEFASMDADETWNSDGPELPCGATTFATVRATNCAGIQRTIASSGSKMCCEAPIVGIVTLIDASGDELRLVGVSTAAHSNITWSGFTDACSGVRGYTVTLQSFDGSQLWNASFDGVAAHALLPTDALLSLVDGSTYTIIVAATSHAGIMSAASTSFVVDLTAPLATPVRLRWSDSTSLDTAVLPSAPISCIAGSVEHVEFSWSEWTDASTMANYSITIVPVTSPTSLTNQTLEWMPVAESGLVSLPLSAVFREEIAVDVAVRGCDSVGLCTESSWHRAHLMDSPPIPGLVVLMPSPGASNGFLGGSRDQPVEAEWSNFYSGGLNEADVLQYEACMGTTPHGCQLRAFAPTSSNERWRGSTFRMPCGETIFVSVRATNCAGLQRTTTTNGTKFCCDAPVAGSVALLDAAGAALHFIGSGNGTHANISWTGFSDVCSGVRSFDIVLRSSGTIIWSRDLKAPASHVLLTADLLLILPQSGRYDIEVTATSHAGLTSTAAVTSFAIDRTPPVAGRLYNGPMRNFACQQISEPLRVSWDSIKDEESGVHAIEWSLGLTPYGQDVLPNTRIDDSTDLRSFVDTAGIIHVGMVIHSTVTVTNGARDVSVFTVPPVRIVSAECDVSFLCLPPLPAEGVHPLMLPLVLGIIYDVSGRMNAPAFMAQTVAMDLRVHVDEEDKLANASRLMRLSVGRESVVRDQYGAPVDSDLTMDASAYPMLFKQAADGTVTSVLHHQSEEAKSLRLKRMLISALQLHRVRPQDMNGSSSLEFEKGEEDHDGAVRASYRVRRGLVRRLVYTKQLEWQPTRRRPAAIEQSATLTAIVDHHGTVHHMRSELKFSTNISKQPLPKGMYDKNMVVEGLDFLPRDPAIFEWKRVWPDGFAANASKPRRLESIDVARFVTAPLFADEPLAPAVCKSDRKTAYRLLHCVLQTQLEDNKPRSECVRSLVRVATDCPALDLEARLGARLVSRLCLKKSKSSQACHAAVRCICHQL